MSMSSMGHAFPARAEAGGGSGSLRNAKDDAADEVAQLQMKMIEVWQRRTAACQSACITVKRRNRDEPAWPFSSQS